MLYVLCDCFVSKWILLNDILKIFNRKAALVERLKQIPCISYMLGNTTGVQSSYEYSFFRFLFYVNWCLPFD